MRTLKTARTDQNISQSRLSAITGIAQPTISHLEAGNISPTINQITLLEQALGPLEWPQNRPFSDIEKGELVQAFAVLVNKYGPKQATNLLAHKSLNELRNISQLYKEDK